MRRIVRLVGISAKVELTAASECRENWLLPPLLIPLFAISSSIMMALGRCIELEAVRTTLNR
jgi:hypothetical protein